MKKPSRAILLAELAKCDAAMAKMPEKIARGYNEVSAILEMRMWTEKAKLIQSML